MIWARWADVMGVPMKWEIARIFVVGTGGSGFCAEAAPSGVIGFFMAVAPYSSFGILLLRISRTRGCWKLKCPITAFMSGAGSPRRRGGGASKVFLTGDVARAGRHDRARPTLLDVFTEARKNLIKRDGQFVDCDAFPHCGPRVMKEDRPGGAIGQGKETLPRSPSPSSAPAPLILRNDARHTRSTSSSTSTRCCRGASANVNPLRLSVSSELLPVPLVRTASMRSQSATLGARRPVVSRTFAMGATPSLGQRPGVGLSPTTPHNDAGTRIEPTVSPPSAAATTRAATDAPAPREEPPVMQAWL